MDKSWFLRFLMNNPRLRSGYWLQPHPVMREGSDKFHDFTIFNPKDKELGGLLTSISPKQPGLIHVNDVYGNDLKLRSEFGMPWSLGTVPTRDLARQLHGYYNEAYPAGKFDTIGGYRISGARAASDTGDSGKYDAMWTRFKPALTGAVGLGGLSEGLPYLNPMVPRQSEAWQ